MGGLRPAQWPAPGSALLEGVDFTGLAWPLPAESESSRLPGRPLLYCADAPVLSRLPASEAHYAFLAPPPASPFFRSTAWPSLIYNLLCLAQPADGGEAAHSSFSIHHSAFTSESDLSSCATLSLAGPPLPPSEDSGDLRPLALFFGLAAFVLVLLRLALGARRGAALR